MPRSIFNEDDYLNNPDKFVFPFVIQEKNKERTIITYNKGQYGESLRRYHERALEWFNDSFAERNEHSFAYHKGVRCADALKEHRLGSLILFSLFTIFVFFKQNIVWFFVFLSSS